MREESTPLPEELQHSLIEIALYYDATLEAFSRALEMREGEILGHTRQVTEITLNLAKVLGVNFDEQPNIRRGALLHDIGKMGVPESILKKKGELTPEEWTIIRKHPQYAYDLLLPIVILHKAIDIPYYHHEKWDGSGYPLGLKGEEIPIAARIFAVVDVWDALISERPQREAWSEYDANDYLKAQSGKHFDPAIVSMFLKSAIRKKVTKPLK
jgi:putative nucleotidyltransferase with HDIG domain